MKRGFADTDTQTVLKLFGPFSNTARLSDIVNQTYINYFKTVQKALE